MITLSERFEEDWIKFIKKTFEIKNTSDYSKKITLHRAMVLLDEFEKWLFNKYPDGGIAG